MPNWTGDGKSSSPKRQSNQPSPPTKAVFCFCNLQKPTMKTSLTLLALAAASFAVQAQQTTTVEGDNLGKIDQQNIGDSLVQDVRTNSTSTQLGNSANANGASISVPTNVDTRDQNTFNPTSTNTGGNTNSQATGGAATGNWSDNDNRSSVGNVSTGPSSATSGPVTGTNTGTNTSDNKSSAITGPSTATSVAEGGAGGKGGAGGEGGSANQGQSQGQKTKTEVANGSSSSSGSTSNSGGNSMSNGSNSGGNQLGQKTNASSDGSGNSKTTTNVDASDRSTTSYQSKAVAWAPVLHGPAAPALATPNLVMLPTVCGPRVAIRRTDVIGVRFGVWGGQQEVIQGYDEVIAPAENLFVQVGPYLVGHQVTTYTATLGTSSAASLSLAGYGKNGDGAQGGGATSGALQQIVQRYTVRECIMAQEAVPVAVVPAPVYVPTVRQPQPDRN